MYDLISKCRLCLKDVRAKCFQSIELFFKEIERVENYPDFETLAYVIQHGPLRFIIQNSKGESTEASDLSHIL